jgi:hypothetical protein
LRRTSCLVNDRPQKPKDTSCFIRCILIIRIVFTYIYERTLKWPAMSYREEMSPSSPRLVAGRGRRHHQMFTDYLNDIVMRTLTMPLYYENYRPPSLRSAGSSTTTTMPEMAVSISMGLIRGRPTHRGIDEGDLVSHSSDLLYSL